MSGANKYKKLISYGYTLFAYLVGLAMLFPFVWLFISSFKGPKEVLKANPIVFFPTVWTLDGYKALITETAFSLPYSMLFTAILGVVITFTSLALCSGAAYAFARLEFRFKKLLWRICIFTMYIPGIAILVTSYMVCYNLGMLDTVWVLILPSLVGGGAIFFFRQFFLNMPMATEEAALVDGANRFCIFYRIFIPNAISPYVLVGTGAFLGTWNSFLWPTLTITSNNKYMVVMQVIRSLSGYYTQNYGAILAGTFLVAMPPIIVFLCFQKYIVKGMLIAGIK